MNEEAKIIDKLVTFYSINYKLINQFMTEQLKPILYENEDLNKIVHTIKFRQKDIEHLKDKLRRKLEESENNKTEFGISEENLFLKINDLIGFRIIHLSVIHFAQEKLD